MQQCCNAWVLFSSGLYECYKFIWSIETLDNFWFMSAPKFFFAFRGFFYILLLFLLMNFSILCELEHDSFTKSLSNISSTKKLDIWISFTRMLL